MNKYIRAILSCSSGKNKVIEEYGLAVGGNDDQNITVNTSVKFDFKTETGSKTNKTITQNLKNVIGINAENKGYFVGGQLDTLAARNVIHVITHATGTLEIAGVSLTINKYGQSSSGLNSYVKGYTSGVTVNNLGEINYTELSSIAFETDYINQTAASIIVNGVHGSTLSSNVDGYIVNNSQLGSNIQKLHFYSETTSILNKSLKNPFSQAAGVHSLEKGYWVGFYYSSIPNINRTDYIDCLRFIDDSVIEISAKTTVNSQIRYPFISSSRGYSVSQGSSGYSNAGIDYMTDTTVNVKDYIFYTSSAGSISKYSRVRNLKGYFSGGCNQSTPTMILAYFKKIEFLDFNTVTTGVVTSTLKENKREHAGVEAFLYDIGYFYGGSITQKLCINDIEVINFTNNNVYQILSSVSIPKTSAVGLFSGSKGYFISGELGYEDSNVLTNNTESIIFATESYNPIAVTSLVEGKKGTGISGWDEGYIVGGNTGSRSSTTIEGLNFLTDSSILNGQTLYKETESATGINNRHGYISYIIGGISYTSSVTYNDIVAFNYTPNGTVSSISSYLASSYNSSGVYSISTGYIAGGVNDVGTSNNRIASFDFFTETTTVLSLTLSTEISHSASVSDNKDNYGQRTPITSKRGLIAGGESGIRLVTTVDGIDFNTMSSIISSIYISNDYTCGVSAPSKGYLLGDSLKTLAYILFNTDTKHDIGNITPELLEIGITSLNSNAEGFILSKILDTGIYKHNYSVIDFITNSMELTGINLSLPVYSYGGFSSTSIGYIFGGYILIGTKATTVKKISSLVFATRVSEDIAQSLNRNISNATVVNSQTDSYIYKGCSFNNTDNNVSGKNVPVQYTDCLVLDTITMSSSTMSTGITSDTKSVNCAGLSSTFNGYICENGGSTVISLNYVVKQCNIEAISLVNRNNEFKPPATLNYNY